MGEDMLRVFITSPSTFQSSSRALERGSMRREPSLAFSTLPGRSRDRGIITRDIEVSHR